MNDAIIPVSADEANALMSAVGHALADWTRVELNVNLLFGLISRIPDQRRLGAVTDGIVAFPIRLSLCNRLMELEELPELELEMWARLSAKITKFYRKRHEIAHFNIMATPRKKKGSLAEPQISPFFSYEKWLTQKADYLSLKQVKERGSKFTEIADAVNWFLPMIAHRMQPEEFPEPDGEEPILIPHIRASASRSLEERKLQGQ
jgi:hypothetical protein